MRQGFRAELLGSTSAVALCAWTPSAFQHGRHVFDRSSRAWLPWWWVGMPWAPA
jgi:hypothetical protein